MKARCQSDLLEPLKYDGFGKHISLSLYPLSGDRESLTRGFLLAVHTDVARNDTLFNWATVADRPWCLLLQPSKAPQAIPSE